MRNVRLSHAGAVNDLNPSLRIGDEGIDSVLHTLYAVRERALSACSPSYHAPAVH